MKKKYRIKWILFTAILTLLIPMLWYTEKPVEAEAATVKLNATEKKMVIGSTYRLKVKNTDKAVKWSSGNKKIATVSSTGKVTAKKAGTTTVTARVGDKKLKCTIRVVVQQDLYRDQMIRLLNTERRKYGYSSFDKNSLLQAAAQKRAKELAQKFSHTRPNGYKWTSAISMKYDFKRAAENIACDFATPQQVVDAWMQNSATKSKIVSKRYNEVGVGVYLAPDGYLYWCVIFGKEK